MPQTATPKLPLTPAEREALRRAGIRIGELPEFEAGALAEKTGLSPERCQELVALSEFQTLGSVGPSIAADLWALGYRSVEELRGENPTAMFERFEELTGGPVDPCVEDTFRCAVAQATLEDLPPALRHWWRWMNQRGEEAVALPADNGAAPTARQRDR